MIFWMFRSEKVKKVLDIQVKFLDNNYVIVFSQRIRMISENKGLCWIRINFKG
jgi:hypothetical protein